MRSSIKFYFRFMFVAGLVFGLCFGAGAGLASLFRSEAPPQSAEETPVDEKPGQRTSILILGSDEREGETNSRSDTIILVTIDPNLKKVAVVSIPRDTRVTLSNGQVGKINAAYALGGPEASVQAVKKLLGTPIDYYMELNFQAFTKVVDTLGGVTINVPQRMYKPLEDINLYPGLQRLDGQQALGFVRWRDYLLGDIDRTGKQQEFLAALAREALQPSTIPKLPALIKETRPYLNTNMGLGNMLKMAAWAPGFSAESVVSQTLPGYFYDQVDANNQLIQSYWVADKNNLPGLVDKMLDGQTVAVVQEGSVAVKPAVPVNSAGTSPKADGNTGKTTNNSINKDKNNDDNSTGKSTGSAGAKKTTTTGKKSVPAATSGSKSS